MERLTIPDVRVDEHTTRRTMIDARAVKEHAMDFYWRLKAYEDTERTPEGIDMDHEAAEQLRQLCRDCDLDRFEELVKADKDGRLVVLPCKVGDTVYWVHGAVITECRVHRIQKNRNGLYICLKSNVSHGAFRTDLSFGKSIFLTREEAEKALEAMKNG